ncbi:flagellar basal body rod protein FlgC [Solirhodobacter olei]|uniref:flagellar basal body rod protein FlgC n=1 Tax=Solirhodobacter olei TaxID=2493082 RepID=UPI000FDB6982|nr:flagellar basal body rod protein FlgC [Solirhodobacter olei]
MDPLTAIGSIAASGMKAQGERLRVVSENVANADSTGTTPGSDPYRRKTISFGQMVTDSGGDVGVKVTDVGQDMSNFRLKYDPGNPAADSSGYVKMPNVNPIIEMANMREASRSYQANVNMLEAGQKMEQQMIDLLK